MTLFASILGHNLREIDSVTCQHCMRLIDGPFTSGSLDRHGAGAGAVVHCSCGKPVGKLWKSVENPALSQLAHDNMARSIPSGD